MRSPRQLFIFRVREFEQMELEFFCKPDTDLEWFQYWRSFCHDWLLGLGIKEENLRLRDHEPEELCFYSKATTDFEYLFPFGWGRAVGRGRPYRLRSDAAPEHLRPGPHLLDQERRSSYIPYVIEPSLGVERSVLAVLVDAYDEEVGGRGQERRARGDALPSRHRPLQVRGAAPVQEAGREGPEI